MTQFEKQVIQLLTEINISLKEIKDKNVDNEKVKVPEEKKRV